MPHFLLRAIQEFRGAKLPRSVGPPGKPQQNQIADAHLIYLRNYTEQNNIHPIKLS